MAFHPAGGGHRDNGEQGLERIAAPPALAGIGDPGKGIKQGTLSGRPKRAEAVFGSNCNFGGEGGGQRVDRRWESG